MLHSKQWHYSLHRDFQNCNSTRRSPTGFFSSKPTRVPIHIHHTENSPSRIQFYMQKTKSSSSTTATYRGQRDLHSRKENSTHRKQGDLLEIHLCVLQDLPKTFQAFQPQDLPKAFKAFQTFQTFQSFMMLQPIQAILLVPISPRNPPHSSILQLECIFYIFYKFYSLIGFHRKLHKYQLNHYRHYKHSFFEEREMLQYRSN